MNESLMELGLSPFFTQPLSLEDMVTGELARLTEMQRSGIFTSVGEHSSFI